MRLAATHIRARQLLGILSVTAFGAACLTFDAPSAAADEPLPLPLHRVHYTVWSEIPFNVNIYYRDVDPPNWAAYSHNPYQFSPKVEADVGPDRQWNLEVALADPDQWAMVVANVITTKKANIHCALAVDGVVVKTNQGIKGALCSIRPW